MLRATLKNLASHKARLVMTAVAIVLGVGLMSGTLVLTDTLGRTFDDLVADIYRDTDAVVRSSAVVEDAIGQDRRPPFDQAVLADVLGVDGVAEAEGFVRGFAQIVSPDGEVMGNPGQGVPTFGFGWLEVDLLNPFVIVDGTPPIGDDEVVVDAGSAKRGDIAVGDRVDILTVREPRSFQVAGVARFGEIDSPGGTSVAIFRVDVAQELLDREGLYDEISVVASEGTSQQQVAEALNAALPEQLEALTGEDRTVEDQQAFAEGLSFFNTFLLVFALIALFVGAFIIHNTFSIIVAQRSRELALFRALGATRRQVISSVLVEALVVGVVASGIGVAFGVAVAIGLKGVLAAVGIDLPSTGTVLTPATVITALVTGTVVTLVAALLPAWKAARVPPIAAMRDISLDTSGRSVGRIMTGSLILGLGALNIGTGLSQDVDNALAIVGFGALLVFIGVSVLGPVFAAPVVRFLGWPLPRLRGVTGTLARENAARNPKRTASTAAALMIGVGLVGFISIFAASARASIFDILDGAVTADLIVSSGQFIGGVSPDLAAAVAEVPGVATVAAIRADTATIAGELGGLVGTDTAAFTQLVDLDTEDGSVANLGDGELAIDSQISQDRGLAIGDVVDVLTLTGERELVVGAVFDRSEIGIETMVNLATYETLVDTQLDLTIFVGLADGADSEAIAAELEQVAAPWPIAEVQDLNAFKDAQVAPIDQLLALIYVLLALAVVIALVGIANTLALSIYERTRELGLLRAVGMSRSQVRSLIRWESVIIAVFGTLLGLAIGVGFGWALVAALASEGLGVLSIPVSTLVVVVLLAALAGVVAALGPARRAARLDVLTAISEE